jgi:hypothetical protein
MADHPHGVEQRPALRPVTTRLCALCDPLCNPLAIPRERQDSGSPKPVSLALSTRRRRCETWGMGLRIAAALFVTVLAGCSGSNGAGPSPAVTAATAPAKPPFLPTAVSSSSVARLPCRQHPTTTLALESCSGHRLLAKNECTSRSRSYVDPSSGHIYVGGSGAPVVYGWCEEQLTLTHLRELDDTAMALAPR